MLKGAKILRDAIFNPPKGKDNPLNIPPQDLSYFEERQKVMKKRMRKHPLRNPDWDPEAKTISLTEFEHDELDPTTSRQVRRQHARLVKKAMRTHFDKNSKEPVRSNQRVVRFQDEETGLMKHSVEMINFIPLTHVYTGRYA